MLNIPLIKAAVGTQDITQMVDLNYYTLYD